jgi:hypothetical protein
MKDSVLLNGGLNLENWMNIGKSLEEILRLQTYPPAVKLVKNESEFPPIPVVLQMPPPFPGL